MCSHSFVFFHKFKKQKKAKAACYDATVNNNAVNLLWVCCLVGVVKGQILITV